MHAYSLIQVYIFCILIECCMTVMLFRRGSCKAKYYSPDYCHKAASFTISSTTISLCSIIP